MAAKALKNLLYLNKFAQKLRDYRLNMYAKEVKERIARMEKLIVGGAIGIIIALILKMIQ